MFPNCAGSDYNPLESLFIKSSSLIPIADHRHQNPSSSAQDHDPQFLPNFPSPFFDEHELPLNQILLQNQAHHTTNNMDDPVKTDATKRDFDQIRSTAPMKRRNLGVVPRRRTGKKDRHSKICTAQGIRDRRMRLSLQVARKFFDLQDMLGFDKASKTIEWLFTKSKKAIKELIKENPEANYSFNISDSDVKSESFVSECEVVSGLIEENWNKDSKEVITPADTEKSLLCINPGEKDEKKPKKMRASREMARARARARASCRTREKVIMNKNLQVLGQWCNNSNPSGQNDNLDQKLGFFSNPSEDQEIRACPNAQQIADVGTIEKLLGDSIRPRTTSSITTITATATVSGYYIDPNYSNFMGSLGNCDGLFGGNPNYSIYTATPKFPGFHQ